MGRYVPPKRPLQCEPQRCYNTEVCNLNLSGLVNANMYKEKKKKQVNRRQLYCYSLCPVIIQYYQDEHESALIQI